MIISRDEKKTFEIYCKIESDREGKILQLYVEGKKKMLEMNLFTKHK